MANIKNLEMSQHIYNHTDINITKGFLGLGAKAVYTPTGSKLRATISYLSADDGERLVKLLSEPSDRMENLAENMGKLNKLSISNCRVETCVSEDHQFMAVQVLRYSDFRHVPACEVRCLEGDAAQAVAKLL